ncbi:hypothetical protein DOK67_0000221 [Enterococcus sp. DIV0212c]|uniref:DUF3284 domain-containing protein n=1 Tax=Candidatus Enterococcus ikei TaxID=2815326 RepID=A0ABS3GV29_9ENTE|nr:MULTISPECIES: DUF3284 domain-containing protein [unclassified Enterococcus]MBO0439112.1 DUF3284 domain-containing protein [Enterococcus sp. DIV0869a]MBO1352773.1 DUF3284 domain-containing protein [Enterococcus sp. DIV0212c]
MEIIKKLNIPSTYFYEKMIDSVIFDIRKHTGKTVTPKQLTNFEYTKQFSKSSRAKIKVEKIIENSAYHFTTATTKNNFQVQYEIKKIDDQSCEIHYTETIESFGFMQKMNDAVVGLVLGFLKKRQFKRMLQMIEESY